MVVDLFRADNKAAVPLLWLTGGVHPRRAPRRLDVAAAGTAAGCEETSSFGAAFYTRLGVQLFLTEPKR